MTTFSELAYAHIRGKLERGLFGQTGELSEPGIARELGFSRTPVREAIGRLACEGLLEQRPKQGTYVRRPTRRNLEEIYQIRLLLEPFVAAEAAQRMDDEAVTELANLLEDMHRLARRCRTVSKEEDRDNFLQEHSSLDLAFHLVLLRSAGNSRIVKVISDTQILTQAFAFPKDSVNGALTSMAIGYREHRRILNAVRDRDCERSREMMAAHVSAASDRTLIYFDWLERHSSMPSPNRNSADKIACD